jgi:hypothetical protein
MCICPTNFGGPGCSTNTQEAPNFWLSETCCDVRNYKCEKISGYGYPFARKTKLHYKIVSIEVYLLEIYIIKYFLYYYTFL